MSEQIGVHVDSVHADNIDIDQKENRACLLREREQACMPFNARDFQDVLSLAALSEAWFFSQEKELKKDLFIKPSKQAVSDSYVFEAEIHFDARYLKAHDLIPYFVQYFKESKQLSPYSAVLCTLFSELYANAVEHGILALDSTLKSTAEGMMNFYQARQDRLAALEEATLIIHFKHTCKQAGQGELELAFEDSGEGFDVEGYYEKKQEQPEQQHYYGRGLSLITSLCDQLHHEKNGRKVIARFRYPPVEK